jgi:Protein of unknown function (DUF3152)
VGVRRWLVAIAAGIALSLIAALAPGVSAQAADPVLGVSAPTIAGTTAYRDRLVADPGEWTPSGLTYSYRWLRDGSLISGADTKRYRLALADIGHRISVRVTATDGVSSGVAVSEETSTVTKAVLTNETAPRITGGSPRFGRVSAVSRGRWSAQRVKVRYQWLRAGKPIRGATKATYQPTFGDFGKRLKVAVTARREGFRRAVATSDPAKVRHRVAVRRTVTYHVETRGKITTSVKAFKKQAQQTYDDPRGWRAQGVKFRRVARGGSFTLVLSEASRVPSFSSECSAMWSCRVGRYVIINQTRWKTSSPAWANYGRSVRDYRHMVVNHETGHWLGRGHLGCPAHGRKAPVMMQQSKGLSGCRANPWPTSAELGGVSARPTMRLDAIMARTPSVVE